MGFRKPRLTGLMFPGVQVLLVALMRWDQGAVPRNALGFFQYPSLIGRADRNLSGSPAFGPTGARRVSGNLSSGSVLDFQCGQNVTHSSHKRAGSTHVTC